MANIFAGRTVKVYKRPTTGQDAHGDPVHELDAPVEVSGVLAAPGDPEASSLDWDPEGVTVSVTLYFPKGTDSGLLEGSDIDVDGTRFRCVGRPAVWPAEIVPGNFAIVWKGTRVG